MPVLRRRRRRPAPPGLDIPRASSVLRNYRTEFDKNIILRDHLCEFEAEFLHKTMQIAGTRFGAFQMVLKQFLTDRVPQWWLHHYIDRAGYDAEFSMNEDKFVVLVVKLRTRPRRVVPPPPPLRKNAATPAPRTAPPLSRQVVPRVPPVLADDEQDARAELNDLLAVTSDLI